MRVIYIHASVPANIPTVVLHSVFNVTSFSVNYQAEVTNDGGGTITHRGLEVNEKNDFTGFYISGSEHGQFGAGYFSGTANPLEAGKVYYARAFAVNHVGVSYSAVVQFTAATTPTIPGVALNSISGITQISALFDATVTNEGGATVTSRGVNFYSNPQCTGGSIGASGGSGTGNFNGIVNTFTQNTTYYARAYATNSYGTAVSNVIEFKTASAATVPVVNGITATPTGTITSWNASSELVGNGGSAVSVSGIVACPVSMGTPTIDNYTHKTTNGPTTPGAISALLTGLTPSTSYNVRGYATNGVGNGYSAMGTFAVVSDAGYELLCEFQTNCPPTKAFKPYVNYTTTSNGLFKWDLAGIVVYGNSVNHNFSNEGIKTIRLYGKNAVLTGYLRITDIYLYSMNIVGELTFTHPAFLRCVMWQCGSNPGVTKCNLPTTPLDTPVMAVNFAYLTSYSGVLDLSCMTSLNYCLFDLNYTPFSSVTFAANISGKARRLNLTGSIMDNMDLMSLEFADGFSFSANNCPNLWVIRFKLNSAYCRAFDAGGCPLLKWVPLNLFPNLLNYNNADFSMPNNSMNTAEVNKIYVHLNDSTSGTFTPRTISIERGNAVPDSSTGGYNGSGAKTTLANRGITITSY